ncbi:hypothetical protein FOL47_008154 [Perkinsus chesapeaki]|uniref:GAF domain-containing protein n=1 Tax=Perkinsus chesapeaki TaxID=330153 RepID=A0A7J6LFQ2_PERCH|nr:hypothetical protein FOL47_008154 [Perkinsus chesapeaki]
MSTAALPGIDDLSEKLYLDSQKFVSNEGLQKLEARVFRYIQKDNDLSYRFTQTMQAFRALLERDRRTGDNRQQLSRLATENEALRKRNAGLTDKVKVLRATKESAEATNEILTNELVTLKKKAIEKDKRVDALQATADLLIDSLERWESTSVGPPGSEGITVSLRHMRRQLARHLHQQLQDEQDRQQFDLEYELVLAKNKALVKEIALANTNTGTHTMTPDDLFSEALSKVKAARRVAYRQNEFMAPSRDDGDEFSGDEGSMSGTPNDLSHVAIEAAGDADNSEMAFLEFEPIYTEAITEPHRRFLERIFAARGEYLYEHLYCSGIPEDQHTLALKLVAKEMFGWAMRATRLTRLVQQQDRITKINRLDEVFSNLLCEICSCLECDRATLWIVDTVRRILWARVPTGSNNIDQTTTLITLEVPIPSGEFGEKVGIVASAYASKEVINIPDAYADPRFNRQADLTTGYRTRTILAVPVVQNDEVVAVIQGINKKTAKFFDDDDQFLLKMWGSVASAIVIRNERLTSSAWRLHRMALLAKFTQECSESSRGVQDIIFHFEKCMRALFGASASRVHLVYGDYTSRLAIDVVNNSYALIESQGFQGLVGEVARSRMAHAASSSGDGSICDPKFDATVRRRAKQALLSIMGNGQQAKTLAFSCPVENGYKTGRLPLTGNTALPDEVTNYFPRKYQCSPAFAKIGELVGIDKSSNTFDAIKEICDEFITGSGNDGGSPAPSTEAPRQPSGTWAADVRLESNAGGQEMCTLRRRGGQMNGRVIRLQNYGKKRYRYVCSSGAGQSNLIRGEGFVKDLPEAASDESAGCEARFAALAGNAGGDTDNTIDHICNNVFKVSSKSTNLPYKGEPAFDTFITSMETKGDKTVCKFMDMSSQPGWIRVEWESFGSDADEVTTVYFAPYHFSTYRSHTPNREYSRPMKHLYDMLRGEWVNDDNAWKSWPVGEFFNKHFCFEAWLEVDLPLSETVPGKTGVDYIMQKYFPH